MSFKTKANTISDGVLDGILRAIELAERQCAGLVIWQPREPFSLGANLAALGPDVEVRRWSVVEGVVAKFQHTAMRLRQSLVPTVCAVRGMALGGSCEFIMHATRTVAALESYIGLVEAGVGLLPAGGGSKELALRAAEEVRRGAVGSQLDALPFIRTYFQSVAMATVAKSAIDAKEMGYLRASDVVVMHAHEVLHVAIGQARALHDAGYRPPLPARSIPVVGKTGLATLTMMLVNMRDGGFISAYDFEVGQPHRARAVRRRSRRGQRGRRELALETRAQRVHVAAADPRTQARIAHTLATGKPLRN